MTSLILKTFAAVVLICAPVIAGDVDIYLLGGQSNMEGQGNIADLSEAQKQFSNVVYFWDGKEFEPLTVGKTMTSNRPERFGLELSFAQKMANGGGPIYLVKYSASGMPLHHGWDRNTWKGGDPAPGRVNFYPGTESGDTAQGTLYREMIQRFQAAIADLEKQGQTPKVRAFLWMQGEQDSKHEASATNYAKSLDLLFQRVKTDVGSPGMKLVYGQVLPDPLTPRLHSTPRANSTRPPQKQFPSSLHHVPSHDGERQWTGVSARQPGAALGLSQNSDGIGASQ